MAPVPPGGGIAIRRLPLLAIGFISLLAGIWAGLIRAGWVLPAPSAAFVGMHGPLVVSGFLGTLIGLERAVAIGRRWAYVGPGLTAAGGLALLLDLPQALGAAAILAGSLVFLAANIAIFRRQAATFTGVMALGALSWAVGNGLWLAGQPIPVVVLWWATYLILTIAGERLELSRLTGPGERGQHRFLAAVGLLVLGAVLASLGPVLASLGLASGPAQASGEMGALLSPAVGFRLAGAGMIALVFWLGRHDMAMRTVRLPGLPRFIAVNILSGYAWLGAAGCLALAAGNFAPGFAYDAFLHLIFLGFVFGMVFGHAPVILPAVIRVPLAFRPRFWVHYTLLQVSILLRVGSDAAGWFDGRRAGAMLNAIAVIVFLASTVAAIIQASAARRKPAA